MNIHKWLLIALLFTLSTFSRADDCLSGLPQSLKSTLEQDNWKILQSQDLAPDDREFWGNTHSSQCPGVAVGNFYPKSDSSFIVALIQRDEQKNLLEKVLLVTTKKNRPETEVVVPPTQVTDPSVVWRLAPGHYRALDGTKAAISRDSFVVEQIHALTKQFYYQGSHLQSLVISR